MALAGDHVAVLVDGYDLTGDHNRIAIDDQRTLLDATTFGMSAQRFIPGQRQFKLSHKGYLNADSGRAHPVLNGVAVNGAISVLVGQNADVAIGDPAFSMVTQQQLYTTNPEVGQVVPFNADFANRGANGGWGVLLQAPQTDILNSLTGSSVDNGAASSNGAVAILHLLLAAGGADYTFEIEQSSDNSNWSSLTSGFTLDGTVVGSEALFLTGTVERYLRFKATDANTGNTIRAGMTVIRL